MEIIPYTRARLAELTRGSITVLDHCGVFSIEGKGALDCLQGIVTVDVQKPPTGSLLYGAFLGSKGAIIVDGWIVKLADRFLVVIDSTGRVALGELLRRQLPPRLAKATDRSDELRVAWMLGSRGHFVTPAPFPGLPNPGQVAALSEAGEESYLAGGSDVAPFAGLWIGVTANAPSPATGTRADLRAARVLAGCPTLGAEIEEKTLPQEADFDRLEGISYSKGCYVGQETVARIHFRGHPNWILRGFRSPVTPTEAAIANGGKLVTTLKTMLRFEDGSVVGLASVRREINPGDRLGGDPAGITVQELPQRVG